MVSRAKRRRESLGPEHQILGKDGPSGSQRFVTAVYEAQDVITVSILQRIVTLQDLLAVVRTSGIVFAPMSIKYLWERFADGFDDRREARSISGPQLGMKVNSTHSQSFVPSHHILSLPKSRPLSATVKEFSQSRH